MRRSFRIELKILLRKIDLMYKLIVNPTSGQGASMKRLADIENLLRERGIAYEVKVADSPEEATRIASCAAQDVLEGVIAIGGDGTLFRIVNGMVNSSVPLLFVSCGTGNDFVRCLNLPADPLEALRLQLDSPVTRVDVGRMNDTCFLNVSGTGFDVDVLRQADRYKAKYAGLKPYLYGLYAALKQYKPMTAMVSIDDEPESEAKFAIISIGNGRYFGGGMKAVPEARINDGLFDVIIVNPVCKLAVLPLLAFYITGKHVVIKLAKLRRCRKLTIRRPGMTLNLDGELIDADVARYELLPAALTVRIPESCM